MEREGGRRGEKEVGEGGVSQDGGEEEVGEGPFRRARDSRRML
jgi:hypothetical protein